MLGNNGDGIVFISVRDLEHPAVFGFVRVLFANLLPLGTSVCKNRNCLIRADGHAILLQHCEQNSHLLETLP